MKSLPSPAAASLPFWQDAYHRHGSAVLAFLESRTGRREDAEDLLQETFVRAIRAAGDLREKTKLRAYLFTIAHNLILNQRRRRPFLLFSQARGKEADRLRDLADGPHRDPEAAACFEDLERRLAEVLAAMPPAHRTAFRSGVLEKRPYREIAAETGWTAAQVKINVYRARRRAMAALADLLPADPAAPSTASGD